MEQVLLTDEELLVFKQKVAMIGVNECAAKLRVSRATVYRILRNPFGVLKLYGRRELMRELLLGDQQGKMAFEVDQYGNSSVSAIPQEVLLMELITDELKKMNKDKLVDVLRFVVSQTDH